jgi:hypothetical protein
MHINTFDNDAFVVDSESFFHLWCCDCNLRHLVVIEAVGNGSDTFKNEGGKIAIAMARDNMPTDMARKRDGIVLYQRKTGKRDVKRKK